MMDALPRLAEQALRRCRVTVTRDGVAIESPDYSRAVEYGSVKRRRLPARMRKQKGSNQ